MIFNYELTLMTAGELSEADSKKAINQAIKLLPDGAKIIKEDDWGLRDLAYHIKKNAKGRMTQVLFTSDSMPMKDFNKQLNLEEDILRYLLLKHNQVKEIVAVKAEKPVKEEKPAKDIKPKATKKAKK